MPRFRVIAGKHYEKQARKVAGQTVFEPVEFKRGSVVETDEELDVKFAGKFVRLDGPTKEPRDLVANRDDPDRTTKTKDRPHHEQVNEEHDDDEVIEENTAEETEETEETEDGKTKKKVKTAAKKSNNKGDKDVSDKFKDQIGDNKLAVFKNKDGQYYVVDPDRPQKRLNKEFLPDAKKVKSFLKKR